MDDIALNPNAPQMSAEQAFERLQTWYQKREQLASLKTHELLERSALAEYYFPRPVEGTNRMDLGGGFDLKLVHGYSRSVDEELVSQVKAADIKKMKLPWDDLIVYKPSLSMRTYNELTAEQKAFVDGLLTIKPSAPSLQIVPALQSQQPAPQPADPDAHNSPQPADQQQPPQYSIHSGNSEDTEPGQYWNDGADWWQLGEDYEWLEVSADIAAELTAKVEAEKAAAKPRRGRPRAKKETA